MAQRRYWNFKDDDATKDINRWLLGLLPKGLYFGFDFVAGVTQWGFSLTQEATGQTETNEDNLLTSKIGKYIMPQGVVVHEDSAVELTLTEPSIDNDRVDLVVATLDYIESEGGAAVQYSIINGTPGDGNPPPLPFPEKQIILGTIVVPYTAVSADDVIYTKPSYLFLGNRPDNFAYIDRDQIWQHVQSFQMMNYNGWGIATSPGSAINLPTKNNLVATTITGNVTGLTTKPDGTPIKVYFVFDCTLLTSGNMKLPGNLQWKVKSGDVIEFVYYNSNGGWTMTVPGVGELARKNQPNKFTATNTLNSGTSSISTSNIGLTNDGNIFYIGTVSSGLINMLGTLPDETIIVARFNNRVKIAHNIAPSGGYSTILCPDAIPLYINAGEYIKFIMRAGNWEVCTGRYVYRRNTIKKAVLVNL